MRLSHYRIENVTEEVPCDYCGQPLEVGDLVLLNETRDRVYCSCACNDRWELFHRQEMTLKN